MSRSSSNSTVMLAAPWREEEEISLTPSTEVTASSTRSTTSVSMISGEAPSQVIEMFTTGKSTSGFWLTPRPLKTVPTPVKQRMPNPMRANIRIHAKTWLRIEMSARVIPVAILRGSSSGSAPVACSSLMAAPYFAAAPATGGLAARRPRLGPRHDLDRDPVGQPVGALGHHRLARLQAGEDLDDARARPQALLDGPQLRLAAPPPRR